MSRTGWTDGYEDDQWRAIMASGAIKSAIRGKRGQAFLRDLAEALDAMPDKRLADGLLVAEDGCKCALGVLGERRGLDLLALQQPLDWDQEAIAKAFGVAESLTNQVQWINDESAFVSDPVGDSDKERRLRWKEVRDWVAKNLETHSARPRERAA